MVAALEEHGRGNVTRNQLQTGEEACNRIRPFAAAIRGQGWGEGFREPARAIQRLAFKVEEDFMNRHRCRAAFYRYQVQLPRLKSGAIEERQSVTADDDPDCNESP